jgi:hypothetical protein
MSMDDAVALFKEHFQIFSQRQRLKTYAVRFIAPPYTDEDANSELVYGHGKNPERISGPIISRLLKKFGISEEKFKEEYTEFYTLR